MKQLTCSTSIIGILFDILKTKVKKKYHYFYYN